MPKTEIIHAGTAADVPGATVDDSASRELQPVAAPDTMLAVIERAARDPMVDVEKLERMMALKERFELQADERAFNEAMVRIAEKLSHIRIVKKNAVMYDIDKNDKSKGQREAFKYAKIEEIDEICRPIYTAENISVTYDIEPCAIQGWHTIVAWAVRGLCKRASRFPLPLDASAKRSNSQNMGSTQTYGQRRALCALFNIVTVGEDNDGLGDAITEAQAAEIKSALKELDADVKKFLEIMKAESVEEIRLRDLPKATAQLQRKRRALDKQKGGANGNNS